MAENLVRQIERTIDAIDLEPGVKACRVVAQLAAFLDLDPTTPGRAKSQFGRITEAHRRHLGSKLKAELDEFNNTFLSEQEHVHQH